VCVSGDRSGGGSGNRSGSGGGSISGRVRCEGEEWQRRVVGIEDNALERSVGPPLIEDNITGLKETPRGAMHKAISLTLPSVADERAHQGFGRELTMHFVGDMDESLTAEDSEARNVGLVSAPGFLRRGVAEGTSQRDIMK